MPVTGRSANRLTPVPGSMVTGRAGPSTGSAGNVGGVDEVEVVGAGDLAGDAAHRHAVAAVGRDGQVEHHVVEAEHLGGVGAGFGGAGGSTRMPDGPRPRPISEAEQIMPSEVRP